MRFLEGIPGDHISVRVPLDGLSEDEVARMVERIAGFSPDPRLVSVIHARTGGNAFYVRELVQLLAADDSLRSGTRRVIADLPLPLGVVDAVRRRVGQRSPQCRHALEQAAVVGDSFKSDILARVVGVPVSQVIELIDEGMAAELLRAGDSNGQYRFSHTLLRETLYEGLPYSDRLRSHLGVALELEAIADETGNGDVDQLAYHFFAAAELGDADKAADYCRRAAARADGALAYEDAVTFRAQAVDAHALGGSGGQARRCLLLIELGEAHLKAGEIGAGVARLREAAAIATDPIEKARAALGATAWHEYGVVDLDGIAVLEETLRALPDADSPLAVKVAGRLATRLDHRTDSERRGLLSGAAVEMARRLGDDKALCTALTQRIFAIRDPGCLAEQMQAADESAELADRIDDHGSAFWAYVCRLTCRLELGDLPAANAALAAAVRSESAMRQPYFRWYTVMLQATRMIVEGDLEPGERLAAEALALRELQDPGAREVYVAQAFALAAQRGDVSHLDARELSGLAAEYHSVPAWRAMLVRVFIAAGRGAEARALLELDARDHFESVRGGDDSLTALALLGESCALLGEVEHAEVVARLLEPWAARSVVFNYGWAFFGSVSRPLGLLSSSLGRPEEAVGRFEDALRADERTGARAWMAHDAALLAGAFNTRGEAGDRARAAELLERAQGSALRLGIAALPTAPSPPSGNGRSAAGDEPLRGP